MSEIRKPVLALFGAKSAPARGPAHQRFARRRPDRIGVAYGIRFLRSRCSAVSKPLCLSCFPAALFEKAPSFVFMTEIPFSFPSFQNTLVKANHGSPEASAALSSGSLAALPSKSRTKKRKLCPYMPCPYRDPTPHSLSGRSAAVPSFNPVF